MELNYDSLAIIAQRNGHTLPQARTKILFGVQLLEAEKFGVEKIYSNAEIEALNMAIEYNRLGTDDEILNNDTPLFNFSDDETGEE